MPELYGTYMYRIVEQRNVMRACKNAQTRLSIRCTHTQRMDVDEDSGLNLDL